MDVNITFLCGDLEEENYIKQLEGFVVKGKKEFICMLKNSLYGLKQSPLMLYQEFDTYILGLETSPIHPTGVMQLTLTPLP